MSKGSKRTEEEALLFVAPILPLLQRGMSEQQACDYSKIPESTLNLYKRKFPKVWSEIKQAKMQLIAISSNTIANAASEDPKIALEVLKRRSRENWGDNIDLSTGGQPFNVIIDKAYDREPEFRIDNNDSAETSDLAESSS